VTIKPHRQGRKSAKEKNNFTAKGAKAAKRYQDKGRKDNAKGGSQVTLLDSPLLEATQSVLTWVAILGIRIPMKLPVSHLALSSRPWVGFRCIPSRPLR
jgi:hypothetical protein